MSTTSVRHGLHHVEVVMGMAVSIDVRDDGVDRAAVDDVVTWLHHVNGTFSTHRMDTPVSRLGLGELTLADLSDEVLGVFALCEELYDDTGGAFDALAVPAPNGSRVDPSGVVKGWAIERAAERLEAHGARNFAVNAGGDVALRGRPEPGRPWRVGIRHPLLAGATAALLSVEGAFAVATSATYERGAHIVDPATGEPTAAVASVTIVGRDLTFVDAYATAVFVMGVDGLAWLHERHPDHEGFIVTHDGRTVATPGFGALVSRART
jgi:thiamine biosynthesis lipoprotein